MREGFEDDIAKFLETKRLAVVGVSRDPRHFSRVLFREFVSRGSDPVPVNPHAAEIEGRRCYACVADIDPPVEAALVMTGTPASTDHALRQCDQAGVRRVWLYKVVNDGDSHAQTLESCRLHGATVIEGYCPFMFLPGAGFIHRVHRLLMKLTGTYPL